MKKQYLQILCYLFLCLNLKSQSLYFPPLVGSTWDTISPTALGWCSDEVDGLLQYLEDNHSKAFILLKDGKIVIEKYFGTFTQDSIWYWASAGKTITSFMLGVAQQENHLSINDTTSQYLGQGWTSCTTDQEDRITVRHQLTMTSSLDDGVPDNHCTLDTCLIYLADAGTRWSYHNAPYTLLDEVIQNATGVTLNGYINIKLRIPTGITGGFVPLGYDNVFFSKARSMARFGLLMLNHGNWNGNQILADTAYFNQMVNTSQSLNLSYGYLWWLNGKASFRLPGLQFVFPGSINPHAPEDMIAALGKNGQIINVVPSQNLVYIRMGDSPGAGEAGVAFNDSLWLKLNEVICNISSVSNESNTSPLRIYPNPVNDFLTVELSDQVFEITLYDYLGRVMLRKPYVSGTSKIDCSGFPGGLYFLLIDDGVKRYIQKVLVSSSH